LRDRDRREGGGENEDRSKGARLHPSSITFGA